LPGKNILYGITGLLSVIFGFLGKTVYRDFIISKNVNDYGIAGFLPSFFYVIGFSLLLLIRPVRFPVIIIAVVTFASVLFELNQYGSTGQFDIRDTLASIAGGIVAFLTVRFIGKGKT
jgi:hypothetical protein